MTTSRTQDGNLTQDTITSLANVANLAGEQGQSLSAASPESEESMPSLIEEAALPPPPVFSGEG